MVQHIFMVYYGEAGMAGVRARATGHSRASKSRRVVISPSSQSMLSHYIQNNKNEHIVSHKTLQITVRYSVAMNNA